MVDANEEFVSKEYNYEWRGEEVQEKVEIPKGKDSDSDYVHHVVARQIAEKLSLDSKYVWRDGRAIIGVTNRVDMSSGVDVQVYVDGSFTLQVYDAGAPIPLLRDQ